MQDKLKLKAGKFGGYGKRFKPLQVPKMVEPIVSRLVPHVWGMDFQVHQAPT
jgi:hypothetical protein